MEQEGGAGYRSGCSSSEELLPTVAGFRLDRPFGIGPNLEGAGILLREHELHEGLPENHFVVLQDRGPVRGDHLALVQGGPLKQGQNAFP